MARDAIRGYLCQLSPTRLLRFQTQSMPGECPVIVLTDSTDLARQAETDAEEVPIYRALTGDCAESATLIYLANTDAISQVIPGLEGSIVLGSERNRTDVVFDPLSPTALIHGPKKYGFIKSLTLGLRSYSAFRDGGHGLHSALLTHLGGGVLLAGPHHAGKSTLSCMYALTVEGATLLSDDWVICNRDCGSVVATALERRAYLDPAVVERVLEAVPVRKVVDRQLMKQLETFCQESGLAKSVDRMGVDRRLYFDPSREVSHPVPVKRLFALLSGADVQRDLKTAGAMASFLMDASYHIPFHAMLPSVAAAIGAQFDVRSLSVQQQLLSTHEFWESVCGELCDKAIVVDTSTTDLWSQCLLLQELI